MTHRQNVCPLCGTQAETRTRRGSYGQWVLYGCGNPQCGPTEISTGARRNLREPGRQAELRALARTSREHGKVPRLCYDGPRGEIYVEFD
ncbi:hypothetical protein AB4Z48_15175 [Cupriavidus sp. 2TAF22]|uniref:hypothetical protein n=1 Tax=unclassified Cupriavidus TaxID=2640874 RepID=UPI003F90C700